MTINEIEFHDICNDLISWNPQKENLHFDDFQLLTLPKVCWLSRVIRYIKRLFCCDMHPAEKVAQQLISLFETHQKKIRSEHLAALAKLKCFKKVSSSTSKRIASFIHTAVKLIRPNEEIERVMDKVLEQKLNDCKESIQQRNYQNATSKKITDQICNGFPTEITSPKDTILICSDGEVKAHWAFLVLFPFFETVGYQTRFEKDKKEGHLKEIDFTCCTKHQAELLLKFIRHEGYLPADTSFKDFVDLYYALTFLGDVPIIENCERLIEGRIKCNAFLCFELLVDLPKHHPALNILLKHFCFHSQWNDWTEVPKEKKEKLRKWVLEFEQDNFKHYQKTEPFVIPVLACCYMGNLGGIPDHKKAFSLLQEKILESTKEAAAKQKHDRPTLLALLGVCHLKGIGTRKDSDEAIKLFNAAKDNVIATYWLCRFHHFDEYGFPQDSKVVEKLTVDITSLHWLLPFLFSSKKAKGMVPGGGIAQLSYLGQAEAVGHLNAVTQLGLQFLKDPHTKPKAIEKLFEACFKGDAEAQQKLSELYQTGNVVPRNPLLAKVFSSHKVL